MSIAKYISHPLFFSLNTALLKKMKSHNATQFSHRTSLNEFHTEFKSRLSLIGSKELIPIVSFEQFKCYENKSNRIRPCPIEFLFV